MKTKSVVLLAAGIGFSFLVFAALALFGWNYFRFDPQGAAEEFCRTAPQVGEESSLEAYLSVLREMMKRNPALAVKIIVEGKTYAMNNSYIRDTEFNEITHANFIELYKDSSPVRTWLIGYGLRSAACYVEFRDHQVTRSEIEHL